MTAVLSLSSLTSCMNDDGYSLDEMAIAVVTVKPIDNNSFYMQLDDNTTLWPVNLATPDIKEETRSMVTYNLLSDSIAGYSHAVRLLQMNPILTKQINENQGEKNDSIYGKDPVELNNKSVWSKEGIWIEDGYLTIDFIAYYGGVKKHFLNLIPATGSTNPYELEFRHNAFEDPQSKPQSGLVSFKLDKLPSTNGETVKLKVWFDTENVKKEFVELDYKSKH